MARDHALAVRLPDGCGVLRFYRWSRPTLSLGRNEPGRERWDPARLAAAQIDVVRRPTGGRAVLHHRELTYAVAVPAAGPGSMRALYAAVNRALAAGLRSLGVPATCAEGRAPASRPDAGPCFARPAEGEVVVDGRKVVGSAQVRIEGRLLQHGSILLADDQRLLGGLAGAGRDGAGGGACGDATEAATTATALDAWLDPAPEPRALAAVLGGALAAELGGDWHRIESEPTLDPALLTRLETRYRSSDWTWRR